MRVTIPIQDQLTRSVRPEVIKLKYLAASGEGGHPVFAITFKDKRPVVHGDRDTEFSDFNRLKAFWDGSKEEPYVLWINAMTIIAGRGEPPEIPANSWQEGNAANREIINWVESRCIVFHMEDQGCVQLMMNMFPYPNNMPRGTETWVGWMRNQDFGIGLRTQKGYVSIDDQANDASLYTKDGLKRLKNDALADLAVRDGIVDAVPSWGQTRLISDILDAYRKRIVQQDADDAKVLQSVK